MFLFKEIITKLKDTPRKKILQYGAWFVFVVGLGVVLSAGLWKGSTELYSYLTAPKTAVGLETSGNLEYPEFSPRENGNFRVVWQNVSDFEFIPLAKGKTLRANLKTMKLYLYNDGQLLHTFDIQGKGKKGSAWEVPGGEYKVLAKEADHFSPNAKIWMPWSIQVFGSYVIHGWPYDSNGRNLPRGNTAGGIRLRSDDAKIVYDFADTNTVVSIYSDLDRPPLAVSQNADYFLKDPSRKLNLNAKSFLVADLDTGEIILANDADKKWPIASVTKLMTALTAYDVVDQNQITTITQSAINTYGFNGAFRAGEKIKTADLIYPLLLESSNDGGEIIAEHIGRRYFLERMNKKALDIGMKNSSFEDPSGLSPQNLSTANDLFALVKHIDKNRPEIWTITKQASIPRSGHLWKNKNPFYKDPQYLGGKTGYTVPAKQTLASVFQIPLSEFETRRLAIIILQSANRAADIQNILSYLKNNVYYGQKELAPLPLEIDPNAQGEDTENEVSEEIKLTFVGDIMLDRGVKNSVTKNFGGDYSKLFEHLGFLRESDILFGNLEGDASDKGKNVGSKYSFRMDPKVLDVLKDAGFDVLQFANNHVGDWGSVAFIDTLNRLEEKGLNPTGAGHNKRDAEDPRIIEIKGTKFGFLGFSDVGPDWLEAKETTPGILLAKDKRFAEIIKNADSKVDVLVVGFHWGNEYVSHNERQKSLAYKAVDNGAEIIAGGHPHVMQDIEKYKGAVIAYSLGNFIFDQYFSTETMKGMILDVKIKDKKIESYEKKTVHLNKLFQPYKVTVD